MFNWGIIGAGRVARRFAEAIGAAPGHHLQTVCSRSLEGAAALAVGATATDSLGELLRAQPDFVYIASPNNLHASHIATVQAAGIPVLCEKPLAATAAAARQIGLITQGPPIGVAFQYRHHPAHARARKLVASGVLGELRLVEVSACLPALDVPPWYGDLSVSGGGILPMSGVHRVDLARHIVGQNFDEVTALVGHFREAIYDDTAAISARFTGGALATFLSGLDAPFGDDHISLHGTAGSLRIESTMSQWWSNAPGPVTLRTADGAVTEIFESVDTYRLQVEAFPRFVAGEGEFATVSDAIAVAEFTEAVYVSAAKGRSGRL